MGLRLLLSDWFGIALTILLFVCLLFAVHDERPATPSEQIVAWTAIAMVAAWVVARGLSAWRAGQTGRPGPKGSGNK